MASLHFENDEGEVGGVPTIELVILWGETVLHVAHLTPPRAFYLGEPSAEHAVDFVIGRECLGAARWALVELVAGHPELVVPPGGELCVRGAAVRAFAEDPHPIRDRVALCAGFTAEIRLKQLSIHVAAVSACEPLPRALGAQREPEAFAYFGLSLAVHAALLASAAFFTPALGLSDDEEREADRVYAIQQYLSAAAEREDRAVDVAGEASALASASQSAESMPGASGEMGQPLAPRVAHRSGMRGPRDNRDVQLSREQALHEARTIGMIGLLASESAEFSAHSVPWGRDSALGNDDLSATGNMWGRDIAEAAGSGGLHLIGRDQGDNGLGSSIGLDRIGTCLGGSCAGLLGAFATSLGRRARGHSAQAPHVRMAGPTNVSGRLLPEIIQRVVRQNFGRFRQCYEAGLRQNPSLQGRVTVRFVIGRDGAVSNAANGGSDLQDSGVVSCVIGTFDGLSFPPPENGIVSVSYPLLLEPVQ